MIVLRTQNHTGISVLSNVRKKSRKKYNVVVTKKKWLRG